MKYVYDDINLSNHLFPILPSIKANDYWEPNSKCLSDSRSLVFAAQNGRDEARELGLKLYRIFL